VRQRFMALSSTGPADTHLCPWSPCVPPGLLSLPFSPSGQPAALSWSAPGPPPPSRPHCRRQPAAQWCGQSCGDAGRPPHRRQWPWAWTRSPKEGTCGRASGPRVSLCAEGFGFVRRHCGGWGGVRSATFAAIADTSHSHPEPCAAPTPAAAAALIIFAVLHSVVAAGCGWTEGQRAALALALAPVPAPTHTHIRIGAALHRLAPLSQAR
jgi:hypothetical protein